MSDFRAHYGIFWINPGPALACYPSQYGIPMWARATNKRTAVRKAREVGGYVVKVLYGSRDPWDAPTFKASGDVVADYSGRTR